MSNDLGREHNDGGINEELKKLLHAPINDDYYYYDYDYDDYDDDEAQNEDEEVLDEDDDCLKKAVIKGIKKFVFLIFVIFIVLVLVRCPNNHNNVPERETSSAEIETGSTNGTESVEESIETEVAEIESSEEVPEIEIETSDEISETETSEVTLEVSSSANSVTKPTTHAQMQKLKVTAKLGDLSSVFGEKIDLTTPNITIISGISGKEVEKFKETISVTKEKGETVKKYKLTPICSAPDKYDVTWVGDAWYTIVQRPANAIIHNKQSYAGEKLEPLTCEVSNLAPGDKSSDVISLDTKADLNKVGKYDILGTCKNPNYKMITEIPKGTYTVIAKSNTQPNKPDKPSKPDKPLIDVTLKVQNIYQTYGESEKTLSVKVVKGSMTEAEINKYVKLRKDSGTSVGEYKITHTCTAPLDKFNITWQEGSYYIVARKVSIQVDDKESFVGDKLATPTYSIISGSVVSGDECIRLTTNADASKVGKYEINATCINSNYDITANKGVYTVKAKPAIPVTIKIESKTSIYGDSIVELDFSISSGDVTKVQIAPYITLTKEGDNNVGSHKITGSCSDPKYNVTFIEGEYTITQRSISVKADDKLTYEGEPLAELTYMLTSGSIVEGDTVISLSTTATPTSIGEYPITIGILNSNYVIQSEEGKYRVKAKPQPPKDEEVEIGGDDSSSSPSESEEGEGPKDEEEEAKPTHPTPSQPEDDTSVSSEEEEVDIEPSSPIDGGGPRDDYGEEVEPEKPTPTPADEDEEVIPITSSP